MLDTVGAEGADLVEPPRKPPPLVSTPVWRASQIMPVEMVTHTPSHCFPEQPSTAGRGGGKDGDGLDAPHQGGLGHEVGVAGDHLHPARRAAAGEETAAGPCGCD